MSAEYSVDGILAVAEAADNGDVRHPGMVADMLRAYAETLQAKAEADVVTNEDVAVARDAYNHTLNSRGTISQVKAMRTALESYALRHARQGEVFGYIDHHEIQKMSDVGHAQVLSRPLPELGITIPVYLTAPTAPEKD